MTKALRRELPEFYSSQMNECLAKVIGIRLAFAEFETSLRMTLIHSTESLTEA